MKKLILTSMVLGLALAVFTVLPAKAVVDPVWDVAGNYIINVNYLSVNYPETLILTQSGTDITGVSLDTIPPASFFTVYDGSVIGNVINIYANRGSLIVHMQGTIASNGSMSGNWADEAPGTRTGTWATTSGNATTIVFVNNLQPNWDEGVYSAYYGPPDYLAVSPGTTALHDTREAGIIKAGFNTTPADDEGLFGFKPTVTINDFAAGTLTYDVQNQTGVNPVWMTIEVDTGVVDVGGVRVDNTAYQFVPTLNPLDVWNTFNAGAGLWQQWTTTTSGITTGSPMTLAEIASTNTGRNVVRTYLRLGMGESYYNGGTGTTAWVDKAIIGGVTYDFVLDATAPAVPTHVSPADGSYRTTATQTLIDWSDVADSSGPVTYRYQSSYSLTTNPDGSFTSPAYTSGALSLSQIPTPGTPAGVYYWHVRAVDGASNASAWSAPWKITVDNTAPTADLIFATPGPSNTGFQVVFNESVNPAEATDPANYFLHNWPGAGGTGNLVGHAGIVYDDSSHTATVTFTTPGWYISPEQDWGVENVHDLAGNLLNPNPTEETSTPMVPPTAPGIPTTSSPTISTTQVWSWTAATDPTVVGVDASGVKGYMYSISGSVIVGWTDIENTLTFTTYLPEGTYDFHVKAYDNAGNIGPESVGAVVVYPLHFGGFLSPLTCTVEIIEEDTCTASKTFKRGSVIPVKFQILDSNNNPVYVNLKDSSFTIEGIEISYAGKTSPLRYDPVTQQYITNWSTKDLALETPYTLTLTLDPTIPNLIDHSYSISITLVR